jgi:hypothetical protein
MQRGGRSKDTWVLSEAPVNAAFSLLSRTVKPSDLVTARANLPSRAAENLFWFGRYGERCEASLRLLRVAIRRRARRQRRGGRRQPRPRSCWRSASGLIADIDDPPGPTCSRAAATPEEALASGLRQLSRVAFNLREPHVGPTTGARSTTLSPTPSSQRGASLPLALALAGPRGDLDDDGCPGFVLDGMTRSKSAGASCH